MAVRIRLKRVGRRHSPAYRLAAMDGQRARDSKVIEELGHYDPLRRAEGQELTVKRDRVEYWLSVGAQPTETVRQLLAKQGISTRAGTAV